MDAEKTLFGAPLAEALGGFGPGSIVGKYRLVRLLGAGTGGAVFVAERVDMPKHKVALKLLRRADLGEREMWMLASCAHPHLVELQDHGVDAGVVWTTMPLYEGRTLHELLLEGSPDGVTYARRLSAAEAHAIFVPIAEAMEALHAAGLRHQDIKPENIFLARFGHRTHPILLDLGVAAELDSPFVGGTPRYASPEQMAVLERRARGPVSTAVDAYALAATLLVALTGSDAYPGFAALGDALARAHEARAEDPLPKGVAPELRGRARAEVREALVRWLAIDPGERLDRPMSEALDVLVRDARRRSSRRAAFAKIATAVAAFVLALASITGVFALRHRKDLASTAAWALRAEKLEREVAAREDALAGRERALADAQRKLDDERRDLTSCDASLATVTRKEGTVEATANLWSTRNAELTKERATLEASVATLQGEKGSLEAQNAALRRERDDLDARARDATSRANAAEARAASLDHDLASARADATRASAEAQSLARTNGELRQNAERARADALAAQAKAQTSEAERRAVTNELATTRAALDACRARPAVPFTPAQVPSTPVLRPPSKRMSRADERLQRR